jgi:hypothetical protein
MFNKKIEIFWTNIASTMAYPNFKNRPKNGLCPLGVNIAIIPNTILMLPYFTTRYCKG